MISKIKYIFILFVIIPNFLISSNLFGEKQNWGEIELVTITESSGLAASQLNNNLFWTHNDSGDKNRIYCFDNFGNHRAIYYLHNSKARDWEDMTIGPGPIKNKEYLYVADIGDNIAKHKIKYVYRFEEPKISSSKVKIIDTIYNVDKIMFEYPDGKFDAETIMLDPHTKDIFILTKRQKEIRIYGLDFPQEIDKVITAKFYGTFDLYPDFDSINKLRYISAGSISSNGENILIKSYIDVFHINRYDGQTIPEALMKNEKHIVNYEIEPQGEAICWHPNNFGYFTLSEENNDNPAYLYFYPVVNGCMDNSAINYNPYSTIPNRSCRY